MLSLLQTLIRPTATNSSNKSERGCREAGSRKRQSNVVANVEEYYFSSSSSEVIECQPCLQKTPSRANSTKVSKASPTRSSGRRTPTPPTMKPTNSDKKKRCGLCSGNIKEDILPADEKVARSTAASSAFVVDGPGELVLQKRKLLLAPTSSSSSEASLFESLPSATEELVAVSQLGHGSFGRVYLVASRADADRVKTRRRRMEKRNKSDSLSTSSSETLDDDDDEDDEDESDKNTNLTVSERNGMSALKTIPLATLNSKKKVEHVRYERKVIELLRGHPNVIQLRSAWRCSNALYLLTEVAWGGELFRHLQHMRKFEPRAVAFFAAEIASALDFAHNHRVVYRDLKPENVLLDDRGHVKVVDFGLSKILTSTSKTEDCTHGCRSLCGTPEYMAPETLERREYGQAVDFWALGMLTAELLSGLPPWYTNDRDELFRRIRFDPLDLTPVAHAVSRSAAKATAKGCRLSAPAWDVATEAADFIARLLDRVPIRRLGCSAREHIKDHALIKRYGFDVDVEILARTTPPYDPSSIKPPSNDDGEKKSTAPPDGSGVDGLVASLHTHFHRAPLVSLTVEDISNDLQREKKADPADLDLRSRQIKAWSYCPHDDDNSPVVPRPSYNNTNQTPTLSYKHKKKSTDVNYVSPPNTAEKLFMQAQ